MPLLADPHGERLHVVRRARDGLLRLLRRVVLGMREVIRASAGGVVRNRDALIVLAAAQYMLYQLDKRTGART